MAEEAARMLLRLRDTDQTDGRIELGTRLVVRNSAAAVRT
jgi:LacI family xylobiose transport system transcriptional regulator